MSKGIVRGLAIVGAIVVIGKIVKNAVAIFRFCKWAKGQNAQTLRDNVRVELHVLRHDGRRFKIGPVTKAEARVIIEGLKNAGADVKHVVVLDTLAC